MTVKQILITLFKIDIGQISDIFSELTYEAVEAKK